MFVGAGDIDDSNASDDMDQQSIQNLGPNVQLITLNTEGAYCIVKLFVFKIN